MASSIILVEPASGRGGCFLRRKQISRVVSMTYLSSVSRGNSLLKSCMSTSNLSSIKPPRRRSVNFSDIEIREYETALGDNPSVRAGPPIGLGWEYTPAAVINVDDYEQQRGPRRSRQEILIPRFVREEKLRDFGVSRSEISQCVKEVEKAKRHRSATMRSTESMEHMHEAMESAGRKVKRLFGLRKRVDLMPSYITVPSGSLKTVYSMNDLDKVVLVDSTSPKVYQSALQAKSCCNLSGLTTTVSDDMLLPHEKNDDSGVTTVPLESIIIPPSKTLKSISSFVPPADVDTATEEEEEEDPLSF